ncbi:MarR family winged helix-turn-helix transcriptional regulator [Actinomadura sp. HBU206391]|uniref:MarR family winged helix-turn-helix transcriptional regulator n=1 Tax=Actinomadura sp. HBU206391 TaxID=2731692 RepID=UPI00164F436C|nr:MarR family transcriptional regulator [Actinomadura sp. HBU206391]MBC6461164.1 MarR family transcriptional regulator [Actinomadura sp. HBU206391]
MTEDAAVPTGPGPAGTEPPSTEPPSAEPTGTAAPGAAEIAGRLRLVLADLNRRLRAQDRPTDLTPSRLSALAIIVANGPMKIGELAAQMTVSAPTVSQLIDVLQDQGLIIRDQDARDRRVSRVRASPTGLAVLEDLRKRATGLLAERIGRLPADQRTALADALPALEALAGFDRQAPPQDR